MLLVLVILVIISYDVVACGFTCVPMLYFTRPRAWVSAMSSTVACACVAVQCSMQHAACSMQRGLTCLVSIITSANLQGQGAPEPAKESDSNSGLGHIFSKWKEEVIKILTYNVYRLLWASVQHLKIII